MSDFCKLSLEGGVYFRMPVAVEIRPDGRVGIEITFAANIAQHGAVATGNDNRLAPLPVAHLRERMPDELAVELGEFVHQSKVFSARTSSAMSAGE